MGGGCLFLVMRFGTRSLINYTPSASTKSDLVFLYMLTIDPPDSCYQSPFPPFESLFVDNIGISTWACFHSMARLLPSCVLALTVAVPKSGTVPPSVVVMGLAPFFGFGGRGTRESFSRHSPRSQSFLNRRGTRWRANLRRHQRCGQAGQSSPC